MAHTVVKLIIDPLGDKSQSSDWHLSIEPSGCPQILCTGEVYGPGVSQAEYEEKEVEKGGITCGHCTSIVKSFKSIKL